MCPAAPFDALHSALGQTVRLAGVLVVDDASTDRTVKVVQQFADQGVRYPRVDHHCLYRTRRRSLAVTNNSILSFLNADYLLEDGYLQLRPSCFNDARVVIVYWDIQAIGRCLLPIPFPNTTTAPDRFDGHFQAGSCIHSATLVRRETLQSISAFTYVAVCVFPMAVGDKRTVD